MIDSNPFPTFDRYLLASCVPFLDGSCFGILNLVLFADILTPAVNVDTSLPVDIFDVVILVERSGT